VASPNDRGYLRGRLVGRLTALQYSDKGYAWIETGRGNPTYFVIRQAVPPEAWFDGSLLEFTPAAPKPGTKSMRAENIIPRNPENATREPVGEELAP